MSPSRREFIPRRQKQLRPPVIRVEDAIMTSSNTLKYSGLTFDRAFNYNEHLRKIREKSMKVANKLVNAIRRRYAALNVLRGIPLW